jgi:hypothetical protein
MKTDDLIRGLVADRWPAPSSLGSTLALAVAAGLAVSASLFAVTLGPRPDIAAAAETARFLFKPLEMVLLAVICGAVILRLAQPGTPARPAVLGLVTAATAIVAAVLTELMVVPPLQWPSLLIGTNSLTCLISIPFLATPILVSLLYALQRGAPTRPGVLGAAAGLMSATLGAALYALHCTDDSPLFVAFWYGIATLIVCAAGALLGARWLRW